MLLCVVLGAFAAAASPDPAFTGPEPDFDEWLEGVKSEAVERGFEPELVEVAFSGVAPREATIASDRKQPEFGKGFCGYVNRRLSSTRIARGKQMLREHADLLGRIQAEYGVPARFIVALWGLETNFGDYMGDVPVFHALATLAYDPRRANFFREEIFAALQVASEGHREPKKMHGSWAGAMGQTQLMPSSFLANAVDYDGDGRKDVWGSLEDALASAASYLRRAGWNPGETWGREVRAPADFSARRKTLPKSRSVSGWRALGVKRADGQPLPTASIPAAILYPTRDRTPVFLTYPNFQRLLDWNRSNFFAITVGSLADILGGRPTLRTCRAGQEDTR